jgi:hypothetical protein
VKAALICPVPELKRFANGSLHLLLAHLLSKPEYRAHYAKQRRHGAYLILDNSAHEFGAGSDPEELLLRAMDISAQEIVVPDVLFSHEGTLAASDHALQTWIQDPHKTIFVLNPRLMYVPQGKAPYEWARCLTGLIQLHRKATKWGLRRDFVIGLSKDYETWGDDGLEDLIVGYLEPCFETAQRIGLRFDVHMLGWGRNLWKLEGIAQRHKWIRSIDSAKPFVYALSDVRLNPAEDAPTYPTRGLNYFTRRLTPEQVPLAEANSLCFKAIASGSRGHTVYL